MNSLNSSVTWQALTAKSAEFKTPDFSLQALFAERVGWHDQQIYCADAVAAEPRHYFSLLLIRQGWPEVLP